MKSATMRLARRSRSTTEISLRPSSSIVHTLQPSPQCPIMLMYCRTGGLGSTIKIAPAVDNRPLRLPIWNTTARADPSRRARHCRRDVARVAKNIQLGGRCRARCRPTAGSAAPLPSVGGSESSGAEPSEGSPIQSPATWSARGRVQPARAWTLPPLSNGSEKPTSAAGDVPRHRGPKSSMSSKQEHVVVRLSVR